MNIGRLSFSVWRLAGCAYVMALLGCSVTGNPLQRYERASGKPATATARTNAAAYRASAPLLFVANTSNRVQIYPANRLKKNPKPVATISDAIGCPSGLAMDNQGTLYVANECAGAYWSYSVTEYPKGQTTHTVSITTGIDYPAGLAVDSDLTLYVSNVKGTPNISEYAAGATSPSKVITGQGLAAPWGLTLDGKENLYVADYVADQVYKIAKGTSTAEPLNLQGLKRPVGVAFDARGNLWVADMKGFVNVYPPRKTSPSQTLSDGYTSPSSISEDAAGDVVVANWDDPDVVYEYAPGQYSPEAAVTKGVKISTGLLIASPRFVCYETTSKRRTTK